MGWYLKMQNDEVDEIVTPNYDVSRYEPLQSKIFPSKPQIW